MKQNGVTVFNRVNFKVYAPDNRKVDDRIEFRPPLGCYYDQSCFEQLVESLYVRLDETYPGQAFKIVQVGRNSFNVVRQLGHA